MRRAVLGCLLVLAAMAAPARAASWAPLPAPVFAPPPLPTGDDIRTTLWRARLTGAISGSHATSWRLDLVRAKEALRKLDGARRLELSSVLAALDRLAAAGALTPSRMPLAFLTLARNTTQWRARAFPAAGQRMTFGPDPAIFQYFPGHGIQFHPLATAGKANALSHGHHPMRFRAVLDRLLALSSRRDGFTAWEYRFDFGGGTAPWISAMTQGTVAQALARGYRAYGDERYKTAALSALGAFEAAPPAGVALGHEYLMYSFSPGLHILNGFLQSVIGLHDVAQILRSARAQRLYERGERVARGMLPEFDTGAWSRYSLDGHESTLSYHELITGFLDGLCVRTGDEPYCREARRFTFYLHEPPRIGVDGPARATQNHRTGFTVSVSKISSLSVTVSSDHGVAFHSALTLPRGSMPYAWTPAHRGRYTVRVAAVGPEGRRAVETRTVRVRIDPAIVAARRRAARERRRAAHRRAVARRRAAARRERAHQRAHFKPR